MKAKIPRPKTCPDQKLQSVQLYEINTNNEINSIKCSGKYLSDNISSFPFARAGEILFFDKGRTGCGGTTLAGQSALACEDIKVVILMPSVASVMSKEEHTEFKNNPAVQFLYGKRNEILNNPRVVFCTYDKLKIVVDNLKGATIGYKLLVDEYHTLARDADFRPVMNDLIKDLTRWGGVTFMSATPDMALEGAIKKIYPGVNIFKTNAVWDSGPGEMHICPTRNILPALSELIAQYKSCENPHNLYIFYNNVCNCNKLIERNGLRDTEYHFLCSSNATKAAKRSSITDINNAPRKINFLTAAGFEGIDILDPKAQAVLVIDMRAPNTIFDWQTILQMTGRCRKSDAIPLILYHETRGYRSDLLQPLQQKCERLRRLKTELNNNPGLSALLHDTRDMMFIGDRYVLNPFSEAQILHRIEIFKNMQSIKKVCEYLENCGFIIKIIELSNNVQNHIGRSISFKKLVGMLVDGRDITGYHNSILAKKAFSELGLEKIKQLDFKVKAVERALSCAQIDDFDRQIKAIMGLNTGMTYSQSQIRNRIRTVNATLNTNFNTTQLLFSLIEMGYLVYKNNNHKNRGYTILKSGQKGAHSRQELYISDVSKVPLSDLKISLCTSSGPSSTWMNSACFCSIQLVRPQFKEAQTLMSECYCTDSPNYHRREGSFNACDFIVLDVDNGKSIVEFNNYMATNFGNALHFIFPTYSYTESAPKYRVIIPLSHTLVFKDYTDNSVADHESVTAYKKLKVCLFNEFHDPKCQLWYYAPFSQPIQLGNLNVLLNADYLEECIEEMVIINRAHHNLSSGNKKVIFTAEKERAAIESERQKLKKYSPEQIVEIINDSQIGNRDTTIFKMVNMLDRDSLNRVRVGILDAEKRRIFEEKVQRRFGRRTI